MYCTVSKDKRELLDDICYVTTYATMNLHINPTMMILLNLQV